MVFDEPLDREQLEKHRDPDDHIWVTVSFEFEEVLLAGDKLKFLELLREYVSDDPSLVTITDYKVVGYRESSGIYSSGTLLILVGAKLNF